MAPGFEPWPATSRTGDLPLRHQTLGKCMWFIFQIYSQLKNLFLTEQRATTKLQKKAMLKLMDLHFKIQCKQGHTNRVADALSRLTDHDMATAAISMGQPTWLQILQEAYLKDPYARTKLTELSV